MKNLGALIRFKKWTLDEKRRVLSGIEQLERNLRQQLEKLAADSAHESAVAEANPEAGYKYAEYTAAVAQRREKILQSIASVAEKLNLAKDDVALAFEELKRYELTQAQRDKERRAELAAKEQAELDEIGLNARRRSVSAAMRR